MNRRKTSPENQTKEVKNVRSRPKKSVSLPWRYRLLTLVCGAFLIGGLFFAARQHFASMEMSIKNSRLRKQTEDLLDDKRRLLLAREIALSPSEIKKAAQKIGFTMMTASDVSVPRPAVEKTEKANAAQQKQLTESKIREAIKNEKTEANKIKEEKSTDGKIKKAKSSNG